MAKGGVDRVYPNVDYKGEFSILRNEKLLIIKVLKICNGSVTIAQKILCPENKPYAYSALLKVIYRHQIEVNKYKKKQI